MIEGILPSTIVIICCMVGGAFFISCKNKSFSNSRIRCKKYLNNPIGVLDDDDFENLTMIERYQLVTHDLSYDGTFSEFIKDVEKSPLTNHTTYKKRLRCEYYGHGEYLYWKWYYYHAPNGSEYARRKLFEMGYSI